MFIGRFYHKLEEKGRLSLPKKFRDQANDWVITRGLDGGLFVFKKDEFTQKIQHLATRTFTKKKNRDFVRLMVNQAQEVVADKNGRISLPEYLIDIAQLKKEVIVVGSFDYLELWDRDLYHNYLDQLNNQAEQISETIENEE